MMSIFRGPGILINPVTIQQPVHIPKLFNLALEAKGANLCALKDELGAIAYSLHEKGNHDEGNRLFDILESGYMLLDQRDNILECITYATPPIIAHALLRSNRYFRDHEKFSSKSSSQKKASDLDIIAALCKHGTQSAAARTLGVSPSAISMRITQTAEDSALAVFKDTFIQIMSDDEIAAALEKHDTQAAAAKTLGVTSANISMRITKAVEGSTLHAFKGVFITGRTQKVSDDEIAAALKNHGTKTAAARALGISNRTVYQRIRKASENSALAVFKGTFNGAPAAAAKTLGASQSDIYILIVQAEGDSALAMLKGALEMGRRKRDK